MIETLFLYVWLITSSFKNLWLKKTCNLLVEVILYDSNNLRHRDILNPHMQEKWAAGIPLFILVFPWNSRALWPQLLQDMH